jgi:L-fuculose-phosphate aldolase
MVAVAGGENIRCCPYALFGTKELSNNVIEAMKNRTACLMANHGLVVGSSKLSNSVYIAEEVESLCEQYVNALAIGDVKLLTTKQMNDVLEKFKNYGALKKDEND